MKTPSRKPRKPIHHQPAGKYITTCQIGVNHDTETTEKWAEVTCKNCLKKKPDPEPIENKTTQDLAEPANETDEPDGDRVVRMFQDAWTNTQIAIDQAVEHDDLPRLPEGKVKAKLDAWKEISKTLEQQFLGKNIRCTDPGWEGTWAVQKNGAYLADGYDVAAEAYYLLRISVPDAICVAEFLNFTPNGWKAIYESIRQQQMNNPVRKKVKEIQESVHWNMDLDEAFGAKLACGVGQKGKTWNQNPDQVTCPACRKIIDQDDQFPITTIVKNLFTAIQKIKTIEGGVGTANDTIHRLQHEIADLKKTNDTMQNEFTEAENRWKVAMFDQERLAERYKEGGEYYRKELENTKDAANQAASALDEATDRILEKELAKKKQYVQVLKDRIEAHDAGYDLDYTFKLNARNEELKVCGDQIEKLEAKYRSAEDEVDRRAAYEKNLCHQIRELEKDVEGKMNYIRALEGEMKGVRGAWEDEQAKVRTQERKISDLEHTLEMANTEIDRKETAVEAHAELIRKLRKVSVFTYQALLQRHSSGSIEGYLETAVDNLRDAINACDHQGFDGKGGAGSTPAFPTQKFVEEYAKEIQNPNPPANVKQFAGTAEEWKKAKDAKDRTVHWNISMPWCGALLMCGADLVDHSYSPNPAMVSCPKCLEKIKACAQDSFPNHRVADNLFNAVCRINSDARIRDMHDRQILKLRDAISILNQDLWEEPEPTVGKEGVWNDVSIGKMVAVIEEARKRIKAPAPDAYDAKQWRKARTAIDESLGAMQFIMNNSTIRTWILRNDKTPFIELANAFKKLRGFGTYGMERHLMVGWFDVVERAIKHRETLEGSMLPPDQHINIELDQYLSDPELLKDPPEHDHAIQAISKLIKMVRDGWDDIWWANLQ